jgi:hypothetical protein
MNWGWFFLWVGTILFLFFVTGWPVTPSLVGYWGNQYDAKNLTYYGVLYFHYLMGGLFFSFLGLGLLRDLIWKNSSTKGGNRQLTFLLAFSMLIASVVAVVLVYRYTPMEDDIAHGTTRQLQQQHHGPTTSEDNDDDDVVVIIGMVERQ